MSFGRVVNFGLDPTPVCARAQPPVECDRETFGNILHGRNARCIGTQRLSEVGSTGAAGAVIVCAQSNGFGLPFLRLVGHTSSPQQV